ncbi:MAG: twin-arginine translocase subunit TatC [Candidatus Neomarinimicrobiota bacterium]
MTDPKEMTFLEHLEELRWRILKSLGAIVLFAILAFIKADWLIGFLTAPALRLNQPVILQALKVSDMFMVQLIASLMAGLVLASPVVIYQIWRFVEPAMGRSSKRITLAIVLFGSCFLLAGITFGYLVLLPFSLRFFTALGKGMVEANYSIHAYLGYVVSMLLAAGLVFQLPVISFILTRIGILTPAFLRRHRKFALVGILVFAAILTPPDPLSQLFMAIPLLGLYELSILISRIFYKPEEA